MNGKKKISITQLQIIFVIKFFTIQFARYTLGRGLLDEIVGWVGKEWIVSGLYDDFPEI